MVLAAVTIILSAIMAYCVLAVGAICIEVAEHGGIDTFDASYAETLVILGAIHPSIFVQTLATLCSIYFPGHAIIIAYVFVFNVYVTILTIWYMTYDAKTRVWWAYLSTLEELEEGDDE